MKLEHHPPPLLKLFYPYLPFFRLQQGFLGFYGLWTLKIFDEKIKQLAAEERGCHCALHLRPLNHYYGVIYLLWHNLLQDRFAEVDTLYYGWIIFLHRQLLTTFSLQSTNYSFVLNFLLKCPEYCFLLTPCSFFEIR